MFQQLRIPFNVITKKINFFRNKSEITTELLKSIKILVLAGPQEKFTEIEFKCLKEFITNGGKIIVLLGEGGEIDFNTNINFLLEDYGISINNDVVVRPHYYKYFHPKEVVVGGGIACESMLQILLDQNKNVITPVDLIDPKFKIEVSNDKSGYNIPAFSNHFY